MRISCGFATSSAGSDLIALAEELGYEAAYLYDSPALCHDVYVSLARAAERTTRIELGTGMAVPKLRHVVTTASALATLHELAPGRVVFGISSGFTGTGMLGLKPATWAFVQSYTEAVTDLLAGREIEWEGRPTAFVPSPDLARILPVEVPVMVAADGPRGRAVAKALGARLCSTGPVPDPDFNWVVRPMAGTVLAPGESVADDRVMAAAAPGAAVGYHMLYHLGGAEAVAQLPNGSRWAELIEEVPEARRHLALHEGHGHFLNEIDRQVIPPEAVAALTLTAGPGEVRERVQAVAAEGVSEFVYNPIGPDPARELIEFARAAM
jgi:5,10-methylenetetrahydromethanopterin reductase